MTTDYAVLLVDDEAQILSALKRLLRKEPYRLFTATSGEEGLEILAHNPIQMVISDQRMPQMSGTEFLQKAKELCPDTIRVMLSGYAEPEAILGSINQGEVFRFLAKPWNDDDLKTTVRQCLDHYAIVQENRRLTEQSARQVEQLERLNGLLTSSVEERTRSLHFAQEVLENLPLGVLGISRDEEIVLSNDTVRAAFADLRNLIPGTEMDGILPPDAVTGIRACLSGESCAEFEFAWGETRCRARSGRIGDPADPRGLVLVLEGLTG